MIRLLYSDGILLLLLIIFFVQCRHLTEPFFIVLTVVLSAAVIK